jgi:predicted ATPase/class 3 adenylate cyclase/tetratricopeptide (TPR) repeat protein
MPELPTGTVTFLFTDLEGSTRLWEQFPDAMQPALARHDEILRAAVASHDGQIVKSTGDGIHAVFATAHDALDAAVAAQQVLTEENWESTGPLRVRMGLHTGETELRDGDYYGGAANRAARLMSVAHGSQIVVSLATEELARDGDYAFTDLGEHRLRDLARAERVFQLDHDGAATEFPPLRSLDAYPGNLPLQLTSFVGRDEELRLIAKALDESRFVTLTGVGGVGKTRLAIQVAADVLPRFPGGAWFCELAAATDTDAFIQVIAATLGAPVRAGSTLESSVIDFLRSKRALLVLDNCEHLLDAAASFAESTLQHCADVRILATSREGLAVPGEQVRPLRSLAVPAGNDADAVAVTPAGQLFSQRAQAVAPDFSVEPGNAASIAEICRRLDGIPLALELAAARAGSMSANEIASLLDERFRLLTGGRRTAVERHQTLRAMVDWSYSMLDETRRLVFDRLGVFSGSFDANAATAIVAGEGVEAWDVRETLATLVDRSMLIAEQTPDGITRYSMLETLRQYARDRLDEQGDADDWRRRHAQHYADFAAQSRVELIGPNELEARRRVWDDLDNLRAAFNWALDCEDPDDNEVGVQIVAELGEAAAASMASGIGMWSVQAVPFADRSTPGRRYSVRGSAAYTLVQALGEIDRGAAVADEVLTGSIPPDACNPNQVYLAAAMAHAFLGNVSSSEAVLHQAFAALDEYPNNDYPLSLMHGAAAALRAGFGLVEAARADAEAALHLARKTRNPSCLALALFAVAYTEWNVKPEAALAAAEESIALTKQGALDGALGSALGLVTRMSSEAGDHRRAIEAVREAIVYSRDVGDRNSMAFALYEFARLCDLRGHPTAGATLVGALHSGVWYRLGSEYLDAERREEARTLALAALGPETYEECEARGSAMTYDEVVAFALATVDTMRAEEADIDG